MTITIPTLQGKKTILTALGLLGLAAYQAITLKDYVAAAQTALGALAALGLHSAILNTVPPPTTPPK